MMPDKQKRSAIQWAELMDAYESSGRTQLEFTKEHEVGISTFNYWRQKLRGRKSAAKHIKESAPFVELRPAQPVTSATLTLRTEAAAVTFSELPDPRYLAELLAGLAR